MEFSPFQLRYLSLSVPLEFFSLVHQFINISLQVHSYPLLLTLPDSPHPDRFTQRTYLWKPFLDSDHKMAYRLLKKFFQRGEYRVSTKLGLQPRSLVLQQGSLPGHLLSIISQKRHMYPNSAIDLTYQPLAWTCGPGSAACITPGKPWPSHLAAVPWLPISPTHTRAHTYRYTHMPAYTNRTPCAGTAPGMGIGTVLVVLQTDKRFPRQTDMTMKMERKKWEMAKYKQ